MRPNFAWASIDTIKKTIDASTQLYRATEWSKKIKRHFKSRFPGANVERVNEVVATDPHFMDVKGAADGITGHGGAVAFQLFVGTKTRHLAVYPIQKQSQFPDVLQDYIRTHGAPKKLYSDNAKAELSREAHAVLRNYGIGDASSEPYYKNQNAAEREIQDVVKDLDLVMQVTNTPATLWPLCVEHIVMVKNHLIRESLGNRTPIEQRTGQTPDISKFLPFRWYEPVYYLNSEGQEELGRWAGVAEHVGDELTYVVISDATGQAMYRSDIRTALDHNAPNFRAETKAADALRAKQDAKDAQDTGSQHVFAPIGHDDNEKVYPFAPDDLVGKVFMREDPETGDLTRCEVVRLLKQHSDSTRNKLKYIIETKNGDTSAEEVIEYTQLCDIIEALEHSVKRRERRQTTPYI
jgi:hypothetical protein